MDPVPPPPDQYAQGPFFVWWDIFNFPIPKWLKAEDVEDAFRATLSSLGYQGGAEMKVFVAVESSTSDTIPKTTQAKWAVLAKPGSIFKYKDCRANPREGISYKEGQKDIADDEIIEQISLWTPPHQMGTTAVVISGDFKILSQCERLRRQNVNVIVVVINTESLQNGVCEKLEDLGVTICEWEWFLIFPHHYCRQFTSSEKPRTEDMEMEMEQPLR